MYPDIVFVVSTILSFFCSDMSKREDEKAVKIANKEDMISEGPLDLSKPSQKKREMADDYDANTATRKWIRQGKAIKLDALCLKLKEKAEANGSPVDGTDGSDTAGQDTAIAAQDSKSDVNCSSTSPVEANNNINTQPM